MENETYGRGYSVVFTKFPDHKNALQLKSDKTLAGTSFLLQTGTVQAVVAILKEILTKNV